MSHPWRPARLGIRPLLAALLAALPLAAAAQDDAAHELGRQVFLEAEPSCAICHTLADAGAEGAVGPSLDQLRPAKEKVRQALESGPGAMPVYSESLSDDEIEAVAEYVAAVAGAP